MHGACVLMLLSATLCAYPIALNHSLVSTLSVTVFYKRSTKQNSLGSKSPRDSSGQAISHQQQARQTPP